ncbi:polyunsaturated fatty acid lipoxygenase ALOX15B-like [Athene noctua]|uniref:polyunsaturated fatty acid lipoxygenase ALOX15B-like n=1 Tax=Athene noctua TaxID=126797 RepID=UPI003EBE5AB7
MAAYRLRVSTGPQPLAGTTDAVAVTLVGTRGRSPRTPLDRWGPDFACGSRAEYRVPTPRALGRLLLLRVHKGPFGSLPESAWFLRGVSAWREGAEPPTDTPPDTPPPATPDPEEEEEEEEESSDDEEASDSSDSEEDEETEGGAAGDAEEGSDDEVGDTDEAGDTDAGDRWVTLMRWVTPRWVTMRQVGDTEAGDNEAGDNRVGDTDEVGDTEMSDNKVGDTEAGDNEAGDTDDTEGAYDTKDAGADADAGDDDEVGDPEEASDIEDTGDPEDTGDIEDTGDPEDEDPPGPFYFPCYRWLQGYGTWDLPEGTALVVAPQQRLLPPQSVVVTPLTGVVAPQRWLLPPSSGYCPPRYSLPKAAAFYLRGSSANLDSKLRGFLDRPHSWPSLEAITRLFCCFRTPVTEYVVQHWQDDAFFGAQYLSGVNPVLLRRCSRLPPNFPVTPPMVAPSLGPATCLQREMEEGNIYLADYAVLEGLPTARIDGHPTYVAAPLCLLHQRPDGQLLPIAIQLSQQPGPRTPIFLPGDPPWLWALAKVWVRSAEFHVHEALTHLLRSHLLGEVYALATLRQLPPQHPLFKLLVPHTRFTVHIACLARRFLLNPGGVFDKAVALGRRGLLQLLARGLRELPYAALVLPRDLRRRGVTRTRRYYFADDARRVWAAIRRWESALVHPRASSCPLVHPRAPSCVLAPPPLSSQTPLGGREGAAGRDPRVRPPPRPAPCPPRFVKGIVGHYYPCDAAVRGDPELQAWVGEIFRRGFLGRRSSGVPSRLGSTRRLVTFLTTVIYSCSAHHAATNSGQFELGAFVPNMPAAMREPPPPCKAPLGEGQVLAALPAMNTSALVLGVLWVLRNEPFDMRALGCYPDRHFTEETPRRLMAAFRRRLAAISRRIRRRNAGLELPYGYLDPAAIENSVAI